MMTEFRFRCVLFQCLAVERVNEEFENKKKITHSPDFFFYFWILTCSCSRRGLLQTKFRMPILIGDPDRAE